MHSGLVDTIQLPAMWDDFQDRHLDPYANSKYRVLLEWAGNVQNKTALVIGAGSGELAVMLAQNGAKVHAMDIDDASIGLTEETARKHQVELETTVATLEDFIVNRKYDLVVATDVLEHIRDDKAALLKIANLVHPDGQVLMTVPATSWLYGFHDKSLGHFRRYDLRQTEKLVGNFLEIKKLRSFGFFLMPVVIFYSLLLKRHYPVKQVGISIQKGHTFGEVLNCLLWIERKIGFGLGTSLLILAEVKKT